MCYVLYHKASLEPRLRLEGQKTSHGKVMLWVDIFTKEEAKLNPIFDIAKPPPEKFELRICVFSARGMPNMDVMTECNDLYFSVHLSTKNAQNRIVEHVEETDIHWVARKGICLGWFV